MLNSPLKITFCGHSRFANQEEIFQELVQTLDQFFVLAIEKDIAIEFYCGGYGTFDHMSSKAINHLREKYTDVETRKFLITPYITESFKERIEAMRNDYDDVIFPPLESVPLKFAIPERNKWMVNECDIVIAYVDHGWGGAAQTLRFAYRKKKNIFRIASDYDVR